MRVSSTSTVKPQAMLASRPCPSAAAAATAARRSAAPRLNAATVPARRLQPIRLLDATRPAAAHTEQGSTASGNPLADGTDIAAKKAATQITIFSSAQYVEGFMSDPLKQAGLTKLNFTEASLDKHTAALAQDSPVVCLFVNDNCNAETVAKLAQCGVKLIAMRCAGYDRVDLEACEAHGIQVVRVPTYSPTSVAEHAVGLMFAINRRLALAYARVSAGNYSLNPLLGVELKGKTVAVLGTGAIGTEAVRIFKGIGMDVVAYDIKKNPAVVAMGVPYVSIEEALPVADVVSVHVPLLKSTYHLINKERIAMMKPGCILLNVSRGGLVESEALLHGLENGQLGGVGMDVYENEGKLFFTDWTDLDLKTRMRNWDRGFKLLTSYPQVLITPHSAFLTVEALANIAATTVSNIEEFLEGRPLSNTVRPQPAKPQGKT